MRRKSTAAPTAMPAIAPVERVESSLVLAEPYGSSPVGVGLRTEVVGEEMVEDETVRLRLVADVSGRSDDFQAIWIIGAYKFKASTSALGSVVKPKLLLEPLWHETVGRRVDVATMRHVWPRRLSQWKPVGQHPAKVSSASIWNCTFHCDFPPATAVQAVV